MEFIMSRLSDDIHSAIAQALGDSANLDCISENKDMVEDNANLSYIYAMIGVLEVEKNVLLQILFNKDEEVTE